MIIKNAVKNILMVMVCVLSCTSVCCYANPDSEGLSPAAKRLRQDKNESDSEPSDDSDGSETECDSETFDESDDSETESDSGTSDDSDDSETESDSGTSDDSDGSETECDSETSDDSDGSETECELDLGVKLTKINKILAKHRECVRLFGKYAVVGDIHGDFGTFKGVVDILQEDIDSCKIDGVVFLGDFWDRNFGDVAVFEKMIEFIDRNNTDSSYKIVVLRGNHETITYRTYEDGSYKNYRENLSPAVREKFDEFYRLLPFNAIINNNTYLVHGGLPYYPDINLDEAAAKLISQDSSVYPQDLPHSVYGLHDVLYSSLWSDFDSSVKKEAVTNSQRGCENFESCRFGSSTLVDYTRAFSKLDPSLKIKNYIFGHDHSKGSISVLRFSQRDALGVAKISVTTVITAPYLTYCFPECVKKGGAVALVEPTFETPRQYLEIVPINLSGEIKVSRKLKNV